MKTRIPYARPSITAAEISNATDAAANGWGERCNEYIEKFETAFAEHLHVPHAIATSSCTGAMHMGLAALGIGPGDQVILADTNWIATAAPIVHLGATPVFVEILGASWCIDPDRAESAITARTKAIIATHLYGNLCDMQKLMALGAKYNIPIIEDAAEAIGSLYRERRAGSMGAFGTFSFHGSKTVSTGEGGMFVTSNPKLYERALMLSNHGRARAQASQLSPEAVGFKYKMSNVQAAIGLAQIQRVEELVKRKRDIMRRYREHLSTFPELSMNREPFGMTNGAWMPTLVFDKFSGITRERLQLAFAQENIDAQLFFHPLSSLPMFTSRPQNAIAYDLPRRAISLPSFHDMTRSEQDRVIAVVRNVLETSAHAAGSPTRETASSAA
ncbi:MAG: DegT/DnrJ/EryC1/StrS family aminotransferase [Gemmatimonadota bacterium]|nr:DegT/DnrJ/EryC1/StrS family aminotransferase [Gemmatimonadota bacterium]